MPGARLDVDRARAETPGCGNVVHLDNAGSALPPRPVLDAVVDHLHLEARVGGYRAAHEADAALERTYDAVATLLGCTRSEVAMAESATRAWTAVFSALTAEVGPGDRILVSRAEYASNALAILQLCGRRGARLEVMADDDVGQVDVGLLAERLDDRVKLVAVTHVPTQGGLVNPAPEIGRLTRAAGVPFLLDACQSAGQLPLDVTELGCDALSVTGRKFLRAPRGTGFLFVRRELVERLEPFPVDLLGATWTGPDTCELRPDARRFETFERSTAGQIGLGVAVDYALSWGIEAIEQRVVGLAERLRSALSELPGVTVHDLGRRRCGIVTFAVAGHEADEVAERLRTDEVNVSVSRASSARFDLPSRGIETLVRASVHYYNTESELDRLVGLVGRYTPTAATGTRTSAERSRR